VTWPMMVPSNGVVPRLSVALNSDSQASKKACFVSRLRSREMLARQFHHPVRFSTHRLKSSGKITTTSHQPGSPEELQHLLSQRFKRRKMIGGGSSSDLDGIKSVFLLVRFCAEAWLKIPSFILKGL
jgi:hypothetical protein